MHSIHEPRYKKCLFGRRSKMCDGGQFVLKRSTSVKRTKAEGIRDCLTWLKLGHIAQKCSYLLKQIFSWEITARIFTLFRALAAMLKAGYHPTSSPSPTFPLLLGKHSLQSEQIKNDWSVLTLSGLLRDFATSAEVFLRKSCGTLSDGTFVLIVKHGIVDWPFATQKSWRVKERQEINWAAEKLRCWGTARVAKARKQHNYI